MERKGSVPLAILLMVLISILLCWLPVIGALIAGFFGGKKAGGIGYAILAVLLPAIILGILLFSFASVISGIPLIGAIAGGGGLLLSLLGIGPLLLGAIIGGALAD
jgi:hypothetical protein